MSRAPAPKRTGKSARRFFLLLVLLAVVAVFLPQIVAFTGLHNSILAQLVPASAARVTCHDATLAWWSPPVLSGVEVRGANGQPVLTATTVRMARTVFDLLQNSKQLGVITVESPALYVQVRPDGSNVEDIVAALADPANPPSVNPPAPSGNGASFQLRVVNAIALVEDVATGRSWRTEQVNLEYDAPADQSGLVRLTATGVVPSGADQSGGFSVELEPTDDGRQQLTWQARGVPVSAALPWLRRVVDEPEIDGWLTAEGSAAWSPTANAGMALPAGLHSTGFITIDQFDFAAPSLAGDRLRLDRVEMPWKISADGPRLVVEELAMNTAVGQLAARGALDTQSLAVGFNAATLQRHDIEIRGNLNLARLAALLPAALRIREGTTISSGDVNLTLRSRPTAVGGRITGNVEAARLAATNRGQPIRWERPIRALVDASWQDGQLRVDVLECETDFGKLLASGNQRRLEANAQFDLDELARQLGQFVDLSDWQPSGSGTAQLIWQTSPDRRFLADGVFHLDRFALASAGQQVWTEPSLTVTAKSAGVVDATSGWPEKVDSATLQLRAEQDSLDAALRQIVDVSAPGRTWPISVRISGDAGRWLARARPLVATDAWQVAGKLDLTADVLAGAQRMEVAGAMLRMTDLRATSPDWRIDEPRVEISGDLSWDGHARRVRSPNAQLVSSTASLAARDLQLALPTEGPAAASGELAVRADLGRVAAMRIQSTGQPTWRTTGMLAGNLRLDSRSDQVMAHLDLEATDLSLAQRDGNSAAAQYATIWQEPKLVIRGGTNYRRSSDLLTLDELRITSQTVGLTSRGTVEQLTTRRHVNIESSIDYDLEQVTPLLKPYVGEGVELVGQEQARLQIVGELAAVTANTGAGRLTSAGTTGAASPHWSHTLKAQLQAPWKSASAYGLPIGEGRIVAALGDGGMRFEPLALAVGGGRMNLAPYVRLDPEPAELTLPRGEVLTDVHISREVSDAMLKYIAPILADATRSEGTFSMTLDGGRVPLGDPHRAEVTGQLRMQSVDVLPGPATEQWVSFAQRVEYLIKNRDPQALVGQPPKSLLRIQDRTIPFRVASGRVYHEGMEFYVGEVPVRSSGSVGFDQSLEMTLQVPVLDKWIDNTPALSGLRGKTVEIPVTGTLAQPRVDSRALTSLSTQLLRDTATGAIGGEINKALNKLFGK